MNTSTYPVLPLLIVDDESHAIDSFEIALRSDKINHFIRCQDSRDVLSILSTHEVEAVLLDLKMPGVDGFEVLEKIKGDASLKKIPVIILTTSSWTRDVEYAYELGANSYIVKPVSFWNFVQTMMDIKTHWLVDCKIPSRD